jgi:DNA repair exonuclease SbcCD ATPase subunit
MSAEKTIVSVEFEVNKRIDSQVKTILEAETITLPGNDHPLVEDYIRKIEGTYDVSRSKEDTDNAIDLLYIAYNTTPPNRKVTGPIRTSIDDIMTRLIDAQQKSELTMGNAVKDSRKILDELRETFEDWEEVRDSEEIEDLKEYIGEDLIDLAEFIKERAEKISNDLAKIAKTYDGIIEDTSKTTHKSEIALAEESERKEEIEKEIAKKDADRQALESLVADLQADIQKYEKMANEYKSQAQGAEERAFIMSIVRVGAEMISSAIPAITAGITGVATGGTSLIAASAASTARQLTNSETAATEDDNTAEVIETKKEIADKTSDKAVAEREKADLEEKARELEEEKTRIEEDEESDEETRTSKLEAIEKRIKDNEEAIKEKEKETLAATTALNSLSEALKSLGENMGQMADKQEERATDLRALQMKMLEKVEAYETERRKQAAELVKINALLIADRSEDENIELAIKSLNLSIKALKRVREIIIEISFFFKCFANFMQQVMEGGKEQSELIQKAIDKDKLSKTFSRRLRRNTNDFYVTQTAEWAAVEIVSAKFVDNFNDGWSKLNKLSGTYLTGDELKDFLGAASKKIEEISFRRKQASSARLAELNRYRARIEAEA